MKQHHLHNRCFCNKNGTLKTNPPKAFPKGRPAYLITLNAIFPSSSVLRGDISLTPQSWEDFYRNGWNPELLLRCSAQRKRLHRPLRERSPRWLSVPEEHLAERETIRWEEQSILGPEEGAEVHCGQGPGHIFIRFFLF